PLNTDPNSHWKNYFRENEILQQIDKDVRRLYPDISFFQQKIARKFDSSDCDILSGRMNNSAHSIDVIKDCFGMTEIRKNKVYDQNQSFDHMAADSSDGEFHWQIRDIFNKHADSDRSSGIVSRMDRLVQILNKEDSELCQQINLIQGIKPHYYAFRWITLLLSQEFPLPDVLRLWDYMFSDENRFDFLLKLCCSMILILRDQLMSGDFASNMKLLQNFPDSIEITFIVARAKTIQAS
ncbi:TBC1 domain family member 13-like protein, partial [Euroglyphus maynei]